MIQMFMDLVEELMNALMGAVAAFLTALGIDVTWDPVEL